MCKKSFWVKSLGVKSKWVKSPCKKSFWEGDGTLQGFGVMFGYDYVASSLGPFADRFLSKTVESIGGITDVFGQQWSGTICQSCASCDKFDIQILLLGLENILNVVAESVAA